MHEPKNPWKLLAAYAPSLIHPFSFSFDCMNLEEPASSAS